MTKEKYLETKKQARVWFTVNILISLISITGGSLVIISQSRHIPFLLMSLGAITLMNRVLLHLLLMLKKQLRSNTQSGRTCPRKVLKYLLKISRKGFSYRLPFF